jgi:hypothetical protein
VLALPRQAAVLEFSSRWDGLRILQRQRLSFVCTSARASALRRCLWYVCLGLCMGDALFPFSADWSLCSQFCQVCHRESSHCTEPCCAQHLTQLQESNPGL